MRYHAFVSSTFADLKDHRRAVFESLRKAGHHIIAMEDFITTDQRPVDQGLQNVEMTHREIRRITLRYGAGPSADQVNPNA